MAQLTSRARAAADEVTRIEQQEQELAIRQRELAFDQKRCDEEIATRLHHEESVCLVPIINGMFLVF